LIKNNFIADCDKFENEIDKILSIQKMYGDDITIDSPDNFTQDHVSILKPRYLDTGWKQITFINSPQFDLPRIRFSIEPINVYNK
jgi:hypothetical protein